MPADNPFRYVAEKLIEPASEDLWPLAVLWFDPATKGLKCSVANVGAELVVGHGRKIGLIIEATARSLVKGQPSGKQMGILRKSRQDIQSELPTVSGQTDPPKSGQGSESKD